MTSYLNEQDCQSRNYNGPVTILKHSIGKIHVSFLKKVSEVVLAAIVYIFQCGEEWKKVKVGGKGGWGGGGGQAELSGKTAGANCFLPSTSFALL
jgi:hypothetical protein